MLIQELIDDLERVKTKVGNAELLEEVYDGRSIDPDSYKKFVCCFSLKKNDEVVIHCCSRDDIEETDAERRELLEKRAALDLFKPRELI